MSSRTPGGKRAGKVCSSGDTALGEAHSMCDRVFEGADEEKAAQAATAGSSSFRLTSLRANPPHTQI